MDIHFRWFPTTCTIRPWLFQPVHSDPATRFVLFMQCSSSSSAYFLRRDSFRDRWRTSVRELDLCTKHPCLGSTAKSGSIALRTCNLTPEVCVVTVIFNARVCEKQKRVPLHWARCQSRHANRPTAVMVVVVAEPLLPKDLLPQAGWLGIFFGVLAWTRSKNDTTE